MGRYDGVGGDSGGGGWRRLEEEYEYGDEFITKYIKKKMKEEINIDKSYKNISHNLFVGYFIGFINIFVFPSLIILSSISYFHKDIKNEGFNEAATLASKLKIIFPYLIFYIGFLHI